MSTDVQNILAAARSLPPREQLELLQGLAESLAHVFDPLAAASSAFRADRSIEEFAQEQRISVATDIHALVMPSWPDDESADDLIAFVQEQRAADQRN